MNFDEISFYNLFGKCENLVSTTQYWTFIEFHNVKYHPSSFDLLLGSKVLLYTLLRSKSTTELTLSNLLKLHINNS